MSEQQTELADVGDGADAGSSAPAAENSPAPALHPGSGDFWSCGSGVSALDDPTPHGQENALQKLGKPPFEKTARGRFRLLGYLATVYEHVSQDVAGGGARAAAHEAEAPEPSPEALPPVDEATGPHLPPGEDASETPANL